MLIRPSNWFKTYNNYHWSQYGWQNYHNEKGITDSWKDHQAILPCLDFVKGICCPHYDEEPERAPFVNQILNDDLILECIAIEGFCALHLVNDLPRYSVSFGDNKNCFLVNKKDSIICNNKIENTELIQLWK